MHTILRTCGLLLIAASSQHLVSVSLRAPRAPPGGARPPPKRTQLEVRASRLEIPKVSRRCGGQPRKWSETRCPHNGAFIAMYRGHPEHVRTHFQSYWACADLNNAKSTRDYVWACGRPYIGCMCVARTHKLGGRCPIAVFGFAAQCALRRQPRAAGRPQKRAPPCARRNIGMSLLVVAAPPTCPSQLCASLPQG